MTFRPQRPEGWYVQRDIWALVQSFPSERIRIYRRSARPTSVTSLGQPVYGELTVYSGKALVVPAGGTVERYGLGQVEEDQPQLLIPGDRDIRQGDFLVHQGLTPAGTFRPGRTYIVSFPMNHWRNFSVVVCRIYQQGT